MHACTVHTSEIDTHAHTCSTYDHAHTCTRHIHTYTHMYVHMYVCTHNHNDAHTCIHTGKVREVTHSSACLLANALQSQATIALGRTQPLGMHQLVDQGPCRAVQPRVTQQQGFPQHTHTTGTLSSNSNKQKKQCPYLVYLTAASTVQCTHILYCTHAHTYTHAHIAQPTYPPSQDAGLTQYSKKRAKNELHRPEQENDTEINLEQSHDSAAGLVQSGVNYAGIKHMRVHHFNAL